jgi:hypothetical protein
MTKVVGSIERFIVSPFDRLVPIRLPGHFCTAWISGQRQTLE